MCCNAMRVDRARKAAAVRGELLLDQKEIVPQNFFSIFPCEMAVSIENKGTYLSHGVFGTLWDSLV